MDSSAQGPETACSSPGVITAGGVFDGQPVRLRPACNQIPVKVKTDHPAGDDDRSI